MELKTNHVDMCPQDSETRKQQEKEFSTNIEHATLSLNEISRAPVCLCPKNRVNKLVEKVIFSS